MDAFLDIPHRFWADMVGRSDGPMTFRFFLQPTMALLMALRDGIKDARAGRQPYYVHMRDAEPAERKRAWREGVSATARILLLGVGMDVIYQFRVFGGFRYPVETFVIAIVLGFLPYLVLRGPVTRIARKFIKPD
ncbi:hypothetical protein [Pseudoxanthomonas suwonensis]|uniref:Transmembrane protein n=1 Tax=Pseudoxanthomonas suwonensis TaxID=314722 RepID=A0A0E3UMX5_9GAMM|nr:hypothetical protein [Pseudoxanthomonas suwonensis]AKC86686.1 hypothetical protein WQ53_07875 [Pseudoxanthomonas suwonensis]